MHLCDLQVKVAHAKYNTVHFGARNIGDVVRKFVPLVNFSQAPVTFVLLLSGNNSVTSDSSFLQLTSNDPITLPPSPFSGRLGQKVKNITKNIEIVFSPRKRMSPFVEEVMNIVSILIKYCLIVGLINLYHL